MLLLTSVHRGPWPAFRHDKITNYYILLLLLAENSQKAIITLDQLLCAQYLIELYRTLYVSVKASCYTTSVEADVIRSRLKRWFARCTVRYFRLCCRPPLSSHHGKPFTSTCGWEWLCLYISLRQGGYVLASLLVWLSDDNSGRCRQIFMHFLGGLGDVSLATKIRLCWWSGLWREAINFLKGSLLFPDRDN